MLRSNKPMVEGTFERIMDMPAHSREHSCVHHFSSLSGRERANLIHKPQLTRSSRLIRHGSLWNFCATIYFEVEHYACRTLLHTCSRHDSFTLFSQVLDPASDQSSWRHTSKRLDRAHLVAWRGLCGGLVTRSREIRQLAPCIVLCRGRWDVERRSCQMLYAAEATTC